MGRLQYRWHPTLAPWLRCGSRTCTSTNRAVSSAPGRVGWVAWAPDSEEIAYVQDATLYRLPPSGGDPIRIASLDVPTLESGSWSPDGSTILVAPSLGDLRLIEIQVQGGEQQVVLAAAEPRIEGSFRQPQYLPDRRKIVYVRIDGARRTIMAADLETGRNTAICEGRDVVYSPSGHLLFWRSWTDAGLWVMPFSVEKLIATGPLFRFRPSGRYPTVAEDGTLAYVDTDGGRAQLVWTDRRGVEVEALGQEQRSISSPQLSPDGMRVLVTAREEGQQTSVWVHDVERASKTRLTFDSYADRAAWRPDGRAIAYTGPGPGFANVLWTAADGNGDSKVLTTAPVPEFPYCWTKDGRFVLFNRNETLGDLWRVEVSEDGEALGESPILATEFEEYGPVLSPDDRYLAYSSDKSGRHEVYVCPFPACERQYLVSTEGGQQPRWRGDGREMYYVDSDGALFAVPVDYTPEFTAGAPERLFDAETLRGRGHRYDVTPDGQRFLVVKQIEPTRRVIRVVDNWFSELHELEERAP